MILFIFGIKQFVQSTNLRHDYSFPEENYVGVFVTGTSKCGASDIARYDFIRSAGCDDGRAVYLSCRKKVCELFFNNIATVIVISQVINSLHISKKREGAPTHF